MAQFSRPTRHCRAFAFASVHALNTALNTVLITALCNASIRPRKSRTRPLQRSHIERHTHCMR